MTVIRHLHILSLVDDKSQPYRFDQDALEQVLELCFPIIYWLMNSTPKASESQYLPVAGSAFFIKLPRQQWLSPTWIKMLSLTLSQLMEDKTPFLTLHCGSFLKISPEHPSQLLGPCSRKSCSPNYKQSFLPSEVSINLLRQKCSNAATWIWIEAGTAQTRNSATK